MPGDLQDPQATQFGFQSRGQYAGEGDGNGIIEGNCENAAGWNNGFNEGCGELPFFWVDLTTANLIDTSITTSGGGYTISMTAPNFVPTSAISGWLPVAKIGQGNFVYIFSFGGINYFGISPVTTIGWTLASNANTMTVQQAYAVDSKVDDGLPQSGSVTACYVNGNLEDHRAIWAAGGGLEGTPVTGYGSNCVPSTAATPYATTNCYDNNNIAGIQIYSVSKNANQPNCALSFRFQ